MKRPVFIVGCPRSGTTLLYWMLLAAGGFAVYRKETYFYDLLPRFPSFRTPGARRTFADRYLGGYLGRMPGYDVEPAIRDTLDACRSSSDFLPLLMERLARQQQAERWMEATPAHVLCLDDIRRLVGDALIVHVIRDGRDCALSLERQQWIRTLPWDRSRAFAIAALYWEWMARSGRTFGATDPSYMEVRFEDLVSRPVETLTQIGGFIDHALDYEQIRRGMRHANKRPNTSYGTERESTDFNPVGRWQIKYSAEQLRLCEAVIGPYLDELGYDRATVAFTKREQAHAAALRATYLNYFAARQLLKRRTPLGRFLTNTSVWSEQPSPTEKPFCRSSAGAVSEPLG